MDSEIELKLLVSPDAGNLIKKEFIQKLDAKVQHQVKHLYNSYYDTPEQTLKNLGMGFRVRGSDQQFEQTIKTKGKVVAGLHQRPEYNVPLENNTADLSLFDASIWPAAVDTKELQKQISCLFTTDFERHQYLLKFADGTEVEMVFDQGKIETKKHVEEICEIELELKSGSSLKLLELSRGLLDVVPFRLGTQSKAQRGYRLLDGSGLSRQTLAEHLAQKPDENLEQSFISAIEHGIQYWQHCEQYYIENRKTKELNGIEEALHFIQCTLAVYAKALSCNVLENLAKQFSELRKTWSWSKEIKALRELRAKKGPYRKMLLSNDDVMSLLKTRMNGILDSAKPASLFSSNDYVLNQLAVLQALLEKPWRNQSEVHKKPTTDFANEWLFGGFTSVEKTFSTNNLLNKKDYLKHEGLLREIEYKSMLVADSVREKYEISEAICMDMLDGVEELNTLTVLENQVKNTQIDTRDELLEWCSKKQKHLIDVMEQTRGSAETLSAV